MEAGAAPTSTVVTTPPGLRWTDYGYMPGREGGSISTATRSCSAIRARKDSRKKSEKATAIMNKPVAQWLANLGVVKTHNYRDVSNDHLFFEAQFKTMRFSGTSTRPRRKAARKAPATPIVA